MTIRDSVFTRTLSEPGGAGSGIDLEPNGNEHVKYFRVIGNRITRNTVQGISIGMSDEFLSTSTISDITVSGNTLDDNGLDATPTRMRFGMLVADASGVLVENNTITRSHGAGISVQYAKGTIVRGNRVSGTLKAGQYAQAGAAIHLEKDTGTVCAGNTLTGNAGPAISTYQSSSTVSGNTTLTGHPLDAGSAAAPSHPDDDPRGTAHARRRAPSSRPARSSSHAAPGCYVNSLRPQTGHCPAPALL